jgi:Zn finger protein HypA/HybF involved in hydrogenase expression
MKTISEHNRQSHQVIQQENKAGVLCDDCRVEMYYPMPNVMLTSMPPKMTVQCPSCNKIDYKIR